jgi:hypothetical protein
MSGSFGIQSSKADLVVKAHFLAVDEFFSQIELSLPTHLWLIFLQVGFNRIISIYQVLLRARQRW